jgi:hypothetical protein
VQLDDCQWQTGSRNIAASFSCSTSSTWQGTQIFGVTGKFTDKKAQSSA